MSNQGHFNYYISYFEIFQHFHFGPNGNVINYSKVFFSSSIFEKPVS